MAHYVLSDIHGEADCFHAMLEKISFSQEDALYILGDVIDRGLDGISLLKEIMGMSNAVMLLGNHEYMMLQYMSPIASETDIRRWNRNGNAPTLVAYHQLIMGHTLVQYLIEDEQEQIDFEIEIASKGEHLRVTHTPGFIDIDCGCGHNMPIKALACLRLEDMEEYYI